MEYGDRNDRDQCDERMCVRVAALKTINMENRKGRERDKAGITMKCILSPLLMRALP